MLQLTICHSVKCLGIAFQIRMLSYLRLYRYLNSNNVSTVTALYTLAINITICAAESS